VNDKEMIMEEWFKYHKANIIQEEDIKVLEWRKPGSGYYGVTYIFHGFHMFVSGDLGDAVFRFSEQARPERIANYSLDYFESKMTAYHEPTKDFNPDKAKKYLEEMKQENEGLFRDDTYEELLKLADGCNSVSGWLEGLSYGNYLGDIDDSWEWLPKIGNETPSRVKAYLIGIKMANEQLNGVKANA
jgi:hypothetical protein